MRIEIVSTGDEVITGSIDDTNASFISRELIDAGLQVNRRHTTGDSLSELRDLFTDISQRHCIAVVTGGLGPTNDDLTTEAIARVANVPLELNEQWLERMRSWFAGRGRTMAPTNIKQAMLPHGALFINNPIGTACGFLIKVNQALFIFAPGVPKELKAMWESSIKDMIISFSRDSIPRTHLLRLFLMGIGESDLAQKLQPIEQNLPSGISFGDRAIYPLIELKIIGHDSSDRDMINVLNQVMHTIAPYYVCRDSYSLLDLINQAKIKLNAINAIDGICRGWFLIHLQDLSTNFVSCNVVNTNPHLINDQQRAQIEELLQHVPKDNELSLLPYQPQDSSFSAPLHFPYLYKLKYNLLFTEDEQPCQIEGALVFGLHQDLNECHGSSYARNRNFLAHLSCVQLYKLLVREPLLIPEDCYVEQLSHYDSRAKK